MSRETSLWLNTNTLIGFVAQRGHAWHYRAEEQGEQNNHYAGAIPADDVRRRLFDWDAVEGAITAVHVRDDGTTLIHTDPNRKAVMRSDTGIILGVFKDSYLIHPYTEWLVDTAALLLDDELQIGSAGLLRNGGQAWVQLEVPETITTPEGVKFRPHLLCATSLDGTLSTTYRRCVTNVVCDNTMAAALGERDQELKIRHSRYSTLKLAEARDALAIVHDVGAAFAAQVAELCDIKVSDGDWAQFLESLVPPVADDGRAKTMADAKRKKLDVLWTADERVHPWAGTAYGVVQAVNTYVHHEQTVRNGERAERNMDRAITGKVDQLDRDTLDRLYAILPL